MTFDKARVKRLMAHTPEELADLLSRLLDKLVGYRMRPEMQDKILELIPEISAILLALEADLSSAHISHRQKAISNTRARNKT